MNIDKFLEFAENIAREDQTKMKRLQEWEDFINPLFKEETGYEYQSGNESLYRKEWQNWIDIKRIEFNNI